MEWLTDFRWIIYLCVNVDMIIAFKKRKNCIRIEKENKYRRYLNW